MRIFYAVLLLFAVTMAAAGDATVAKSPVTTAAQGAEQSCLEAANKKAAASS